VVTRFSGPRIAIAVALAAVVIAGVLIYIARRPGRTAAEMMAYFIERDAALFYADVAAMRNSGVLDKLVGSAAQEEPEYKNFVSQTGFDYKRDLDRVMLSSANGVHYFLLHGRFRWPKLKDYARQHGGGCDGDYCWLKGSTPDRIISFYPVSGNLMALASAKSDTAAKAIERRPPGQTNFELPSEPVWLNLPASFIRSQTDLPSGTKLFARALEPAERVLFTAGPEEDRFRLTMNVTTGTEEQAAVLKAQLEGITTLLQKLIRREDQKPNPEDLSGVLTAGSFERTGRNVIGRWPIRPGFLESLAGGG
jgi:hypothetical protein